MKTEDKEKAADHAVAPRVTLAALKAKIDVIDYLGHGTMTICVLTMQNDFKIIGKSAPASPDNFDPELGRKIAYENALDQAWGFEGYLLAEHLQVVGGNLVLLPREATTRMVNAFKGECAGDADEPSEERVRQGYRAMVETLSA